jgi:5'-nucleotidase
MKTILLINDDGIQSSGLLALKRKLDKLGKVVVITPKEEISGIGKAITSAKHVRIEKAKLRDGSSAYATSGTPADSYLLGVYKILKRSPNLVVTGINLGPNLGIDDFLNSGTLGAAIEAAIHGVPAIAVSFCKQTITDRKVDKAGITVQDLELAASLAQTIVEFVLRNGMPKGVDILSVNVPEKANLKRVRVTRLSYVGYRDIYAEEEEGYRIASWRLADYGDPDPDTDVYVVKEEGCVSITPIKVRLEHNMKALRNILTAVTRKARRSQT